VHTIADVVVKAKQFVDVCIVADDNSTDETVREAQLAGAYVARHDGLRGAGRTTKVGIDAALAFGADIVVTLDGDGQHDPLEIPSLLEAIKNGEADIIIGSRFLEENHTIPLYRKFGIKVITWIYNIGCKQKLSDAQCCFRAWNRRALAQVSIPERSFSFSTSMLIRARALGFRIKEVPVKVLYHRNYSQNSTINPVIHGLSVALATLRLRWRIELRKRVG